MLTWNQKEMTAECLDSVLTTDWDSYEIILLDNGSADDSFAWLSERYKDEPRVNVFRSETNLGYSGGNNEAVTHASGSYLALLNNDTEVEPQWLSALMAPMKDDSVGMVAAKVLNFDERTTIDNVGHLLYPDGLNRGRGRLEKDNGQYDQEEEVLFPSGCACLYRTELFHEIDGFDDDFFIYGDDTDLGLRARLAGYRCIYAPQAVVYHRYSLAFGEYSTTKAFLVERNRLFVAIKCLPMSMLLTSPLYTAIRFGYQAYGALFGKGAAGRFTEQYSAFMLMGVLLKAYGSALIYLPRMIARRREFRKKWRLTAHEAKALFLHHRISVRELALKD